MSESKSNLAIFCTEQNLVRSTYYSDTYRAVFELDGVTKTWDITHIEFPFSQNKERELKARFGIADEELLDFYKQFAVCVQNGMRVANYISGLPDEEQDSQDGLKRKPAALKQASALFTYREIRRKEDVHGSDIWLVTEPMEPFVGSEYFSGTSITLRNLLSFATRTAQSINGLASFGLHIGALDLDTILLQSVGGKKFFCFGSFLYAGFDEGAEPEGSKRAWPNMQGLKTLPENTDPAIRSGAAPSLITDMHALAAVLWSMLSGKCYRDAPDYSITPKYAPPELLEALTQARVSDDPNALRVLYKTLSRTVKEIGNKRQQDIVIHMEPPKEIVLPPIEALSEKTAAVSPERGAPDVEQKVMAEPGTDVQAEPQTEPQTEPQAEPQTEHQAEPQKLLADPAKAKEPEEEEQKETLNPAPNPAKESPEIEEPAPPPRAEVVAELIAVPVHRDDDATASEGKADKAKPKEQPPAKSKGTPRKTQSSAHAKTAQTSPPPSSAQGGQQQVQAVPNVSTGVIQPGVQVPMQGGQMGYPQAIPYMMPTPIFVLSPGSYPGYGAPMTQYPGQASAQQGQGVVQSPKVPSAQPERQQKAGLPKFGKKSTPQARPKQPVTTPKKPVQQSTPAAPVAQAAVAATAATAAAVSKNATAAEKVVEPATKPEDAVAREREDAATSPEMLASTSVSASPSAAKNPSKKVVRRTVTTVKKGKKNKAVSALLILFLIAALALLGAAGLQYMGYDVPWNIPLVDELHGSNTFTVTPTEITLYVGEETVLTSSEGCTLNSSDHNVAVVSDTGHVRGVGAGTCTITARAASSSAIVRIKVTVLEF